MKQILIFAMAAMLASAAVAEEDADAVAQRREYERQVVEQNAARWIAGRDQRMAEARERIERERAEQERQARLPGARIGMTAKQVLEGTSWGKPIRVNRTLTTHSSSEQWVYDGGYLYFEKSRLTAIQN